VSLACACLLRAKRAVRTVVPMARFVWTANALRRAVSADVARLVPVAASVLVASVRPSELPPSAALLAPVAPYVWLAVASRSRPRRTVVSPATTVLSTPTASRATVFLSRTPTPAAAPSATATTAALETSACRLLLLVASVAATRAASVSTALVLPSRTPRTVVALPAAALVFRATSVPMASVSPRQARQLALQAAKTARTSMSASLVAVCRSPTLPTAALEAPLALRASSALEGSARHRHRTPALSAPRLVPLVRSASRARVPPWVTQRPAALLVNLVPPALSVSATVFALVSEVPQTAAHLVLSARPAASALAAPASRQSRRLDVAVRVLIVLRNSAASVDNA
jgi:hypothetical protein